MALLLVVLQAAMSHPTLGAELMQQRFGTFARYVVHAALIIRGQQCGVMSV